MSEVWLLFLWGDVMLVLSGANSWKLINKTTDIDDSEEGIGLEECGLIFLLVIAFVILIATCIGTNFKSGLGLFTDSIH